MDFYNYGFLAQSVTQKQLDYDWNIASQVSSSYFFKIYFSIFADSRSKINVSIFYNTLMYKTSEKLIFNMFSNRFISANNKHDPDNKQNYY